MKNNPELIAYVRSMRTYLTPLEVSKAVVKLRKLAKTLSKRYQQEGLSAGHVDTFDMNTQAFFGKAYTVARDIGCVFEMHQNGAGDHKHFYLRVDARLERLA